MFDVGDEQFLVLLLVMNPENDDWFYFIEEVVSTALERRFSNCESIKERYRRVSSDGGSRDQAAAVAAVHVARGALKGRN